MYNGSESIKGVFTCYRYDFLSDTLLRICINLHDTGSRSGIGTSHTGASSPQLLFRIETLVPVQNCEVNSFQYHVNAV